MKIVRENGQCVAHTKGFDPNSSLSTLPFDGNEDDNDDDVPQVPNPP